jgi:hypothetical protein
MDMDRFHAPLPNDGFTSTAQSKERRSRSAENRENERARAQGVKK